MRAYEIRNIVFDVGNVIIRWEPHIAVMKVFGDAPDPLALTTQIFKNPIWKDLNRGTISEDQAIAVYSAELGFPTTRFQELMLETKRLLSPVEGTLGLIQSLHAQGYPLHLLTDNTLEIVKYLRTNYDFWQYFSGMVCSAEVGYLKPSREIYQVLLEKFNLMPEKTVFIDDIPVNVQGAKDLGIHAIQFTTLQACKEGLSQLGVLRAP